AGLRLDNGKLHRFSYSTEVLLDQARGSVEGGAGYRMSSTVDISLVWRSPSSKDDQLVKVAVRDVRMENVTPRPDNRNIFLGSTAESVLGKGNLAALQRPLILHWSAGKVKTLYSYQNEHTVIKNLKRGLASLIQLQLTSGKVEEVDVSGKCAVEYQAAQNRVTRIKNLDSCKTAETGFTSHSEVLGVSSKSSSTTEFILQDGFIKSAVSEEAVTLLVNTRRATAATVLSRQKLELVKMEAGPQEVAGKDPGSVVKKLDPKLEPLGLAADRVKSECKGCPSLWQHWQKVRKHFEPESLSHAMASRSFLALIQTVRRSQKEEILKVLQNSSRSALPQVVDAVTSAQTSASLEAVLQFLDFSDPKGLVLQERFLYACGFSSHPNERMLKALLGVWNGKIGSSDIRESVVIIMGALVRKLCQKGGCELPTVLQVKKLILEGPEGSKEEAEVQMYLLAMKNALLPEAIPLLTKFSESGTGPVSTIAITTLQRYDHALITEEVKKALNRIYHQNRRVYEKSVRAAAADVLFSSSPSAMVVQNLLLSIGSLPHEMNKYMLSKVQDILHFDMSASKVVRSALRNMVAHNYDRFSKIGSSSSFSGYMARASDTTSTYSLDILYSGSGILRRSNMNIYAFSGDTQLHASQVVIEAQGLESLIAATADAGEEELESFSGMSALLFDVQLRPVTFFKGYSDLMAKMFTATGEPINVVKGLILLIDHSQV
ncbi:MTP protein, partial [Amia calva]|nr:MTP protein [Amia calva]